MKLLLDACVWGGAQESLERDGHDVECAGLWAEDPGDVEILHRAHVEGRILVTLDKDFGELAVLRRVPHAGILRLVRIAAREQGRVAVEALRRAGHEMEAGAIVTVSPERLRIRAAEEATGDGG